MRKISVVLDDGRRVQANYARRLSELAVGLWADPTAPLLMEVPFLIRGSPVTTKPRGGKELPTIAVATFDGSMRPVRQMEEVPSGSVFKLGSSEKYVLEIPAGCGAPVNAMLSMKRLRFFL